MKSNNRGKDLKLNNRGKDSEGDRASDCHKQCTHVRIVSTDSLRETEREKQRPITSGRGTEASGGQVYAVMERRTERMADRHTAADRQTGGHRG